MQQMNNDISSSSGWFNHYSFNVLLNILKDIPGYQTWYAFSPSCFQ